MPDVKICDVTLRDGMQVTNRDARIPLTARLKLAESLQRAGLPYLEVGSFVSPRFLSSMHDTPELLAALAPRPGQQLAALVPKRKYYHQLQGSPHTDTVAVFISASEDYSLANTRMTREEALDAARDVAYAARHDGYRLRSYLSYAFRDPSRQDGETPLEATRFLTESLLDMGCETVALSDTDGRATPHEIDHVLGMLAADVGTEHLGVHLHDRYGQGLANALVAFQAGVRVFDCSVGGIGGNAAVLESSAGNLATEELVFFFHGMNVDTGIDFDELLVAARMVAEMTRLVGDPPPPSKILADLLAREPAAAVEDARVGGLKSATPPS